MSLAHEDIDEPLTYLSLWRGEVRIRNGRVSKVGDTMTMREIVETVARENDCTVEELRAPDGSPGARKRPVAHARQLAMWTMIRRGKWSLTRVGKFLGGRDHSTVLAGVRRHQERLDAAQANAVAV